MKPFTIMIVVGGKVVCTVESNAPLYPPVGSTVVLHDERMPEEFQSIPLKVLHHTTEIGVRGVVIVVAAEIV